MAAAATSPDSIAGHADKKGRRRSFNSIVAQLAGYSPANQPCCDDAHVSKGSACSMLHATPNTPAAQPTKEPERISSSVKVRTTVMECSMKIKGGFLCCRRRGSVRGDRRDCR